MPNCMSFKPIMSWITFKWLLFIAIPSLCLWNMFTIFQWTNPSEVALQTESFPIVIDKPTTKPINRTCVIWMNFRSHYEILPSMLQLLIHDANVTQILFIVRKSHFIDSTQLMHNYYNTYLHHHSVSFEIIDQYDGFPSSTTAFFERNLTHHDIILIITGYWSNGNLLQRFQVIKHAAFTRWKLFHFWVIFHDEVHRARTIIAHRNLQRISLSPMLTIANNKTIAIVPTESYYPSNAKHNTRKYNVIIQGTHLKRDHLLLLNVFQNDIFIQHNLSNYFIFNWYGRHNDDLPNRTDSEQNYIEFMHYMNTMNHSIEFYEWTNITDDDQFQYLMSLGDIFFTLTSSTFNKYNRGTKFTSTLVYPTAFAKPVTIYHELYAAWKRFYHRKNDHLFDGWLPYHNATDLASIMYHIAYNNSYYSALCDASQRFTQFLRKQNVHSMHNLLEKKS
eukprot:630901_1